MKRIYTLLIIVLTTLSSVHADDVVWKWGENETEAHGNWNFMTRLIDQKNYNEARKPLYWLLQNTPDLNVGLYIQASKVYEHCVKLEKNDAQRIVFEDSALTVYDLRVEKFGDANKVLNRKGKVAYKYLSTRSGQFEKLYDLYSNIYEQNGKSTYTTNLVYYFSSACALYNGKKMSQEEILNLHSILYQDLDERELKYMSNSKKLSQVTKCRESIDNLVGYYKLIDCDYINNTYASKWEENKGLKLAQRINSMIITGGCKSSDLFFETADKIIEEGKPSFALLKLVGNAHLNRQELDDAYTYFEKAIAIADDSVKSADLHYQMARIDQAKGRFVAARSKAYNSLKADPTNVKAYELIGNMYMDSYKACGSNEVEERAVFIAAYNMYKKAGNSSKMAAAKAQFPAMKDIFLLNHNEGDQINTGCWINETVVLQKR